MSYRDTSQGSEHLTEQLNTASDYHHMEVNVLTLTPTLEKIITDSGVFKELITDGVGTDDIWHQLRGDLLIQVSVGGEFAGFFSLEDLGEFVGKRVIEVHAYILPAHRRFSLTLLRGFRDWLFKHTSFSTIVTQTPSRLPYLDRVLGMVGFNKFEERSGTHSVRGVSYNTHYHYLERF